MSEAGEGDGVELPASAPRAGRGLAVASLAVGLAAAAAAVGVVRSAVQKMPPLSPTDSMIVSGGRPNTPGAARPSPVRPQLRRRPPEPKARGEAARGAAAPGNAPNYPRLQ